MRLGIFTNNYLPLVGGVSTAVEAIRRFVEARGHEVYIFAPRYTGYREHDPRVIRYPSVPALTHPDFALPIPFSPSIADRIRGLDLDLVHAQHPFLLGQTARRVARHLHRPLVFTYHTRYEKYAHYVPLHRRVVERKAIEWSTAFANQADLVIAPSRAVRALLAERGVIRPIEVIPTGVEVTRYAPGDRAASRRALGLPLEAPIALYLGRLDREKNVGFLLEAFDRVVRHRPEARLVLVGRGAHEAVLRRLARGLAAGERVHFAGPATADEAVRYYQAADLFVFASTTETQGLVVAEAMAAGLPVVAVRAPGVEELVQDGVTGFLVPEDPAAFALAVDTLLADEARRRGFGERAREAVRDYAAERTGSRLLALYEALIAGRPAGEG